MSKSILRYLITAVVGLSLTCQAFAHAHLVAATPPAGGTVNASPTELDLKFSEALNLKFSGMKVTGPNKAVVNLDEPMLMDGDTEFMATISDELPPGIYAVDWHVLSTDGHKTHGRYTFTVKP